MAAAPKKKPQGASRNAPKNSSPRKPAPGWLWLLLGAVMASFVFFLMHLWNGRSDKVKTADTGVAAETTASTEQAPGNEQPTDKNKADKLQAVTPNGSSPEPAKEPRFDFYTLLPSQKAMPNKASADAADKPAAQAVQAQQSQQAQAQIQAAETPHEQATAPAQLATADKTTYFLQAGSFKSEAEADNRRASILMLGLPVKVVTIHIKEGQTWYRVVVGPMKGKAALESTRASLRAQGVDTVTLKQG